MKQIGQEVKSKKLDKKLAELIKGLETQLLQPDIRKSRSRLIELIGDDFIEIGSSGRKYNKHEVMEVLSRQPKAQIEMKEFEARELSSDAVLVTFLIEKTALETGEKKRSLQSSIWKNNRDRWQVIFHQGTSTQS